MVQDQDQDQAQWFKATRPNIVNHAGPPTLVASDLRYVHFFIFNKTNVSVFEYNIKKKNLINIFNINV